MKAAFTVTSGTGANRVSHAPGTDLPDNVAADLQKQGHTLIDDEPKAKALTKAEKAAAEKEAADKTAAEKAAAEKEAADKAAAEKEAAEKAATGKKK